MWLLLSTVVNNRCLSIYNSPMTTKSSVRLLLPTHLKDTDAFFTWLLRSLLPILDNARSNPMIWSGRLERIERTLSEFPSNREKVQCRKRLLDQLQCKQMTVKCQSDTDQGFRHDPIMRTCWVRVYLENLISIDFFRLTFNYGRCLCVLQAKKTLSLSCRSKSVQPELSKALPDKTRSRIAIKKFMRIFCVWYIN